MKRFLSLIRFFTTTVIAMLAVCALAWLSHPVAAAEPRPPTLPPRPRRGMERSSLRLFLCSGTLDV